MCVLKEIINLFFIKSHWSYFSNNDLSLRLNIYKIIRKEHQIVFFTVTHEIATSETPLWKYLEHIPLVQDNYKKLKMIYNVFYFKCGINVNDNFRRTCKKTTKSALNITLLDKFIYRIIARSTKSLLLHKNLTRTMIKMSSSRHI